MCNTRLMRYCFP